MSAFVAIHQSLWRSFRRLPLWVQLWMAAVLLPANLLSLFLLQYPGARMVAIAAVLALGSNMLLMYGYAGFTRLMALPHLLVWGPLQVMLPIYLMASAPTTEEVMYIGLVLAVNGISPFFDTLDSWRWLQGERQVF
ncbi:hypothetical protein PSCT_04441 [Pseudomonas sp. SCT]|jgi:hypothetical protein|uniref:hypothetical protein n=1 Tax=Pseudomonas sp. (strain SCT) TaxID=412955 RepID=UPI000EEAAAEE|nr:hypothetical protein [Pseudomonas sp. SCT]GCA58221.1 hypothetical protein PSCT_04441 [Pseudomonas sp. SCT]